MEKLLQAESLLMSVVSTMETIDIRGIDNQDKFVGCANAVRKARKLILDYTCVSKAKEEEDSNG